MELLIIAGLVFVVYKLAQQTPPDTATTGLPPDVSLPATGATRVPSPAKANGMRFISQPNEVRLRTSGQYVQVLPDLPVGSPHSHWARRKRVVKGGNYMTDADPSIMTQNVAPQTPTVASSDGTKV